MEKRVELVISIPERAYEIIKNGDVGTHPHNTALICSWIKNGTPLPKGHGALKDEKDLITKVELNYRNSTKPIYVGDVKDMIRTTVSVIKVDKEGAEDK